MRLMLGAVVAVVAAVVVVQQAQAADGDFQLHLLDSKRALGKCLDGSPAGFYHRESPSDSRSWVIHLEGGGFCPTFENCAERAQTALGSSSTWNATYMDDYDGGSHGFLSTDPTVNPDFYDWNMVRIKYCDGAFFAGDRVEPLTVNGTTLYFRGRYIIQESFKYLFSKLRMHRAREIIITGCSAGSVGVFLHLDWIRHNIPRHIRVVGAPDSGFFLEMPNYHGQYIYDPIYNASFYLHNSTFTDADCPPAYGPGEQFRCGGSLHVAPFVTTPMFVMNSLGDAYQFQHLLMLDCFQNGVLSNCSEPELEAIANFRLQMISELKQLVLNKPLNGAFLPTCLTHCGACTDQFWDQTVVNSVHLRDAFSSWYFGTGQVPSVLVDGPWPSSACSSFLQ